MERKDTQHGPSTTITEQSDGKEIRLQAGQSFTVTLAENPSTGYVWRFVKVGNVEQNAAAICSITGDVYIPRHAAATGAQVGAPGVHQWRFRADTPGTATLEMQLIRPWEAGLVKRSFMLHLHVL